MPLRSARSVGAQILAESVGRGLSEMAPGSIEGLQVVVDDINAARADLVERGSRSARSRNAGLEQVAISLG